MIHQKEYIDNYIKKIISKKNIQIKNNYNLLNNCLKNNLFEKIVQHKLLPYRLEIEATTRCTLKCKYCQVPIWERKNLPDMNLETFKSIIDKFPHCVELKLQGQGEPLLNKNFFDMVKYAVSKDMFVRSYTNGLLLNKKNCEKMIDSNLFELRISVDGANKNTVENHRIGINYDKLINNITYLVKAKKNKKLPIINLSILLTKNNFLELPNFVELAHKLKVDGIKVQVRISHRTCKSINKIVDTESLSSDNEKLINVLKISKEKAKIFNLDFEIFNNFRSANEMCLWIWNTTIISSEGDILICPIISDPKILNFGNVLIEDIEEILTTQKYNNFRMEVQKFNFPRDECKRCFENM